MVTRPLTVPITIRRARPDDVAAIVTLVNQAYRATEGDVFPGTTRTERTDVATDLERILVAERDGAPAACVHLRIDGDRAHFGMLATDVKLQGGGIASALIDHVESVARDAGCRIMCIDVVKEGGRVPFYERRGYRIVRETPGQIWNGGADWGAAIEWHMVDMEKSLG